MLISQSKVLDASIKRKYVRAKDGPFITQELCKAIMHRSKLKNRITYNSYKQLF